MTTLTICEAPLTLAQLRAVLDGPVTVSITHPAWTDVERGAATVAAIISRATTTTLPASRLERVFRALISRQVSQR